MAITVVRRVNRLLSAGLFAIVLGGCAAHAPIQPNARLADVLKQQQSADAAYKAGDMQTAADLYARLVHEVPSEADYWYRLGNVQFRQQQPDVAVAERGLHEEQCGGEDQPPRREGQQPTSVEVVGERAAVQPEDDERHEPEEPGQPDVRARPGQGVDLCRDGDDRQLRPDDGDDLGGEETPVLRYL